MTIRRAQESDAAALAAVHIASWKAAYRGIVSDAGLESLSISKLTKKWQEMLVENECWVLVYETGGKIAGFSQNWPCRDDDKDSGITGEVGGIYFHPDSWGKGRGTMLLESTLNLLREKGFSDATLWVLEDNTQARKFYKKAGFIPDGKKEEENVRGSDLVKMRYSQRLVP